MIRYVFAFAMAGLYMAPALASEAQAAEDVIREKEKEATMPDPAVQSADARKAVDRKICRTSIVTGSRLQQDRVCRTAAEWEAVEREVQEAWNRRSGLQNTRPRE